MKPTSPYKVAAFSLVLLALGFVIGLGYQSYQNANKPTDKPTEQKPQLEIEERPPVIQGLRVSPDDQLAVFSAIYDDYTQSSRFVFDLQESTWDAVQTPTGWQDSMVQWGKDGRTLLYERSKIPQIVIGAKAGIYSESIISNKGTPQWNGQKFLSEHLRQPGERIYAGFWSNQGQLALKTQHSDRSLFTVQNGEMKIIDRSPGTYYQNRSIETPSGEEYYVVRNVDREGKRAALFHIANNHTNQIGEEFEDIIWAYLSEDAKWLLICTNGDDSQHWQWRLYEVRDKKTLNRVKTAQVPSDVIAVYWSPDFQHILGAVGNSLWLIDIPTLKVRQIGTRDDWYADDAAWLNKEKAVVVASKGQLWKVDIANGDRKKLWELPQEYWH